MDIYHLRTEAEPEEKTALDAVIDHIKDEMERLNKMEEEIMSEVRASKHSESLPALPKQAPCRHMLNACRSNFYKLSTTNQRSGSPN